MFIHQIEMCIIFTGYQHSRPMNMSVTDLTKTTTPVPQLMCAWMKEAPASNQEKSGATNGLYLPTKEWRLVKAEKWQWRCQ